jgi:putative hydrolase of the HAD superfamily
MVRAYRNHAPKIAPYPGVLRGLKRLRRMGVPLGLLSDGQPAVQRRKLAALKLNNLFDAIVITGDIGPRFYKPHPAGFEQLIRELDTDPARTVYVGDNPATDFVTARKLGMTTVRVRRGEYAAVPHDPRTVDVCVHSAAEALQWLLQQLGRNGTRPSRNTHNTEAPTR